MGSKLYINYAYGPFSNPKYIFSAWVKVCFFGWASLICLLGTMESFHIANHKYYGQSFQDEKKYRVFDERLDLYRYVDKTKYD